MKKKRTCSREKDPDDRVMPRGERKRRTLLPGATLELIDHGLSQPELAFRDLSLSPAMGTAAAMTPAQQSYLSLQLLRPQLDGTLPESPSRLFTEAYAENLSVAATSARLFGGSNALWPLSGVMMRSASGHARWSAHALSIGQTTS